MKLTDEYIKANGYIELKGFPGGSAIKDPCASAGDAGWVPGWEDLLEKEMATTSSILAWEVPWTEELGGPWGHNSRTQLSD